MTFSEATKDAAFRNSGKNCECRRKNHTWHVGPIRCKQPLTRSSARFRHITAQYKNGGDVVPIARPSARNATKPQIPTGDIDIVQFEEATNRYTSRALTTSEIISELVKFVKEMLANNYSHNRVSLSLSEAVFYDGIVQNDAVVLRMGDEVLKRIAVELVTAIQVSATIDWSLKESVRATMRSKVRRLLAKYDYPPDREEKAVELILQQAELFVGNRY